MQILEWLTVYLILSLLVAALYVRRNGRGKWTKFLRKYFYLFPLFPIIVAIWVLLQVIAACCRMIFASARWIFEKLSGKKTYRRKSIYFRQ
jgi:hypothetical protein